MLTDLLDTELRNLDQLTADLDRDVPEVRRARRLLRRWQKNPRLRSAPLTVRYALFDARALASVIRKHHTTKGETS